GVTTFAGIIEGVAGENKIPSLYANMGALPSAGSYHGMFAHVHATGRGYFAHAGNWLELVNKDTSGNVGLSGDLDVDGHTNLDNVSIAGVTTATGLVGFGTHITLKDYARIQLGEKSGGDFFIGHNPTLYGAIYNELVSTNGNILLENRDSGANKYLYLKSDQVQIRSYTGNESFITCGLNADVKLWYDNVEKLATTNTGINVTGNVVSDGLVVDGNTDLNGDLDVDGHTNLDNVSIAGVTTITSSASSALYVAGRTVLGNNTNLPTFNAATLLAVANLSGNNNFVDMTILGGRTGRSMVKFGDQDNKETGSIQYHHSDDSLKFFTNGSSTERLIINSTGNVKITNDLDVVGIATLGSGASGYAELFYQGVKKFETKNYGALIPGSLVATYDIKAGSYVGKLIAGTNNEFTIQHDNTNTIIDNTVGILDIKSQQVAISTHLSVGGISTFAGNVDINADIDVDGHTNLDNVSVAGVTTTSDEIHLKADNKSLFIGNNDDLTFFHDGSNSYIKNTTGDLLIMDTFHAYVRGYTSDKSVALGFNNNYKLRTTNTGINVTGNVVSDGLTVDGDTDLNGDL
ncbi:MAG: hypothetical protein VXY93_09660, partial [Pseudomonadota bacterium]|nr:hypothetical protein [Pseudomonadota bacterium]